MSGWNILFGVILLIWATPIGPEEMLEPTPVGVSPQKPAPPPVHGTPAVRAKELDRDKLRFKKTHGIDEAIFMREFKYQAQREGLFNCLNLTLPSPRSLLFEAVILKSGIVSQVDGSGTNRSLPGCARELMMRMRFPQSGATMSTESHTVIWRVDW
jgi:hypothetical protein